MQHNDIAKRILDFINSEEYLKLKKKAKNNQGCRTDLKCRKIQKIDVNDIISKKFRASRTYVSYLIRIKENKYLVDEVKQGNISASRSVIHLNRGNDENIKDKVYFVQEKITGRIKIGTSTNIEKRYSSLVADNAGELKLLLLINGYRKEETKLHKKFFKYRHHGEWFEPAQEILDYIKEFKNKSKY